MGLGLSDVVPTLHFVISEGLIRATTIGQLGGFSSWPRFTSPEPASTPLASRRGSSPASATSGYVARRRTQFRPPSKAASVLSVSRCVFQFHSHQLFHILVVAGAFVHFHGVSNLQEFRYTAGAGCADDRML